MITRWQICHGYLDIVFISPTCEAITSGHCRKILLPTNSQNWWNVDQVAHKLRNLWSIMCKWEYFFCLMAHFANNSKGIQEIPLCFGLSTTIRNTTALAFDLHPAQFPTGLLPGSTKNCQIPWCKIIIWLQVLLLFIKFWLKYLANIFIQFEITNSYLGIAVVITWICHWNKFSFTVQLCIFNASILTSTMASLGMLSDGMQWSTSELD